MDEGCDWWALIGPVPTLSPAGIIAVPHDRFACLDREYDLGPVTLRPGGRRLTEYLRSEPYSLDGVTWFETWPVIVQGKWPGDLARPLAERTGLAGHEANLAMVASWLHRGVCLVSFATGEAWQVRTAAVEMTARPPQVPEDWPAPPIAGSPSCAPPNPEARPLPAWISTAWQALEGDGALASALNHWHQGLLLMPTTPSFAFLAFCASVEGIAESTALRDRIDPKAEPCSQCGNVPRASARFWSTVALVRDDHQVAELKKRADPYGRRSTTAHGRGLHGIETEYGRMHMLRYAPPEGDQPGTMSFDPGDETQTFMWQQLPEIRLIATDLVRAALGVHEGG